MLRPFSSRKDVNIVIARKSQTDEAIYIDDETAQTDAEAKTIRLLRPFSPRKDVNIVIARKSQTDEAICIDEDCTEAERNYAL